MIIRMITHAALYYSATYVTGGIVSELPLLPWRDVARLACSTTQLFCVILPALTDRVSHCKQQLFLVIQAAGIGRLSHSFCSRLSAVVLHKPG